MDAVERRTTSHKQRVPLSTTLLFVVAVNPEDVQYNWESVLHHHHKARGPPKRHKSCLLASHDEQATTIEPAVYPVPLSSLSTRRMCSTTERVYSTVTTKRKDPQTVTSPRLLASQDTRATTREPAAYPVPLSLLSTRRMCSTTGRVYCSATTKLEDHRNVTSPICLHPMIRRRRRGNRQLIHSICQSEHPRLLPSSMYYPLHRVL